LPLALAACVSAVAAGGCAAIPSSGPVRSLTQPKNEVAQGGDFPQLIPAPPGKNWTARQIVSGFLAANASFASGNPVAREYLAPHQIWKPRRLVTVVSRIKLTSAAYPQHLVTSAEATQVVVVSGQQLAPLTAVGQYLVPPPSTKQATGVKLKLIKVNGQWRIVDPPQRRLLSKSAFLRVYQPRNLYFFGAGGVLVPDPVFVPLQATTTGLATDLVKALRQRPLGYLSGVTRTELPRRTVVGQVKIEGPGAIVNLGGPVTQAGPAQMIGIAAQLVWTLTSSSYGSQSIKWVKLEVNGRLPGLPHAAGGVEMPSTYSALVPRPSARGGLYFTGTDGAVQVLPPPPAAAPPGPAAGQAGTGQVPMTSIAVSPAGPRSIAGISANDRVVNFGPLAKGAALRSWRPGGRITSLSWDARGDLWVAAGNAIWLRQPGKAPVAVDSATPLRPGGRVTALRIAPDGVRIAMIVHGRGGAQLEIGAVTLGPSGTASIGQLAPVGAGIVDPAALNWYNADNLIVLAGPGSGHVQLAEVPVSGGQPTIIVAEPHTISLATNGSQIVAGLQSGRLVTMSGLNGSWEPLFSGQDPAYAG
jgi:Lipoprotein LpqB beta-propeller domain/Sporulation and spore germination